MNKSVDRQRLALLVGALGVVYGDIGTSPLYALRECFAAVHGVEPLPQNVIGVVSLILWSLTLIVSVKYLGFLMRANNRGEGGILALLSLALQNKQDLEKGFTRILLLLGIFGAALLYGDGIITPAVTVLSAVEGLEVATPVFQPYIVPIAVVVLVSLFSLQRFGTGRMGSIFGPIMVLWFLVLGILGVKGIFMEPGILRALSPLPGIAFLVEHGHRSLFVLGAVFLSVTGAEALYADMGHFGARPIRRAWFAVVFPGLLLNYLGEGALILSDPAAAKNPFYLLAPSWSVLPLVCLATMAAIIASQALISGAYSITMQGVQMGYLPRLYILHTSHEEKGQIFMPQVNGFLMVACVGLVLGFESSSRLAGAYGIAVSLTMLITTTLFFGAARSLWKWSLPATLLLCGLFGALELAFVFGNAVKIVHGGWFPLVLGIFIFTLMTTWKKGRKMLGAKLAESYLPFDLFLQDLDSGNLHRVPGTAVFLSGNSTGTPIALLHNIRHNKVLHRRVIILTIETREVPLVPDNERIELRQLRPDIYRVSGACGFMEQPNVPALLAMCAPLGLVVDPAQTTFFLSRETVIPQHGPGMRPWRRRLFAAMSRNAQSAAAFFRLPPNRVVELGMQVEI
jgi:KUP system potassium uptake protein